MFSKLLVASAALMTANSKAITGTNIGGWLVLEPWITPSLFYRFLGKNHSDGVGIDSWTLCESLGPKEGNALMRAHWDSWYTEDHIKELAARGVEMVRVPVGDWTLDPYCPYVGCMDGADEKITWMLDTCEKYNIKVLIDVHTAKGSQNGFDNSGQTSKLIWKNETHYSHWGNAAASWLGDFDWLVKDDIGHYDKGYYKTVNYENIQRSLRMTEAMLKKYGKHPAFGAFEPVNEPWWLTDLIILKDFYRKVRAQMQELTPDAKFVFHDSFRYSAGDWDDLFEDGDHENVVMDHHYYHAFFNLDPKTDYTIDYRCGLYKQETETAKDIKYDVWFGEWALATDNCAHWLNGFNDGAADAQYECKAVECPKSYLPKEFAVDFDRTAENLGPYGYNFDENIQDIIYKKRTISKGMCWSDSEFYKNEEIEQLAKCILETYNENLQGQFIWTGHNEIEEKWDYIKAYDLGWLNQTALKDESTHYKNKAGVAKEQELEFLQ
jgi:glucan 1,3-beta-glucosidase